MLSGFQADTTFFVLLLFLIFFFKMLYYHYFYTLNCYLTHDFAPRSDIKSCIKIDKPLVVLVVHNLVRFCNDSVKRSIKNDNFSMFSRLRPNFKVILMSYDK